MRVSTDYTTNWHDYLQMSKKIYEMATLFTAKLQLKIKIIN